MSDRYRSFSRRDALKATGAAATFGLAGCLGGSGGGTDDLTVAYMPIYPDMQYFVMEEEGYLDELPVPVDAKEFSSGPDIVQAYASGEIDVAMFGIVPAMIVIDRGIAAQVVAANIQEPMGILGHEEFAAMWDPESPADSFAQWADEKGRPFEFGTFPEGSVPDILLRYWLSDELGIDPASNDHVEITGLGGANAVFQGLANDEVDGTSIMEPVPTKIRNDGLPYEFVATSGEFMPGQPAAVTLMSDDVRDGDAGAAFVREHQRATEFVRSNRDTAAEHASSVIGESSLAPAAAKQAMESPLSNFVTDPHVIEDGTEVFASYAADLGKTDAELGIDQIFDYSLYDGLE
ncbi:MULTISPECIES: ABC transporter substrate-binding protein [Halolamina]|uniref:NitT/TauT family transport system substrate-binding protein n=1 Tax=Halolamina pelagica TaxID=699431 RepID=A0A1I5QRQ1_9EURY|nr:MULTISPECIES: ABC transporter substrate-binding protein [Halolamina]NHX35511.1 ABC transporter substrate-binding protein [Halolamina sp. R1-12]SFP48964.1 NitT/TauT family transport system substrate-binding protein [Halolamina pelagica]